MGYSFVVCFAVVVHTFNSGTRVAETGRSIEEVQAQPVLKIQKWSAVWSEIPCVTLGDWKECANSRLMAGKIKGQGWGVSLRWILDLLASVPED